MESCISLWICLHFSDDWYWTSFNVLFGHLYIFLGEMSIDPLPIFNWAICLFLNWVALSSLYIQGINHLSDIWLANIISHSVGCLFTFFMVSFEAQKFLILMESSLSVFSFVAFAFGALPKKALPNPKLQRFTPTSSSKSFIILVLTFRNIIHFKLIFVCGLRKGSNFILYVDIQLS